MTKKLGLTGFFGVLTAALLPLSASASFVFGFGSAVDNQAFTGTLGDNFSVTSPVAVTQLGVFTPSLASSGGSVPIAIYKNAGSPGDWTLVGTSYNVTSTDYSDTPNQTTYIKLNTPLVLSAGLYSVVTITSSDYNSGVNYPNASLVAFNSVAGVTAGGYDIWQYGGSLTPTLTGMQLTGPSTSYPWSLPVFGAGTLSLVPVPEASTVIAGLLLLLPFGASALKIMRRNAANPQI